MIVTIGTPCYAGIMSVPYVESIAAVSSQSKHIIRLSTVTNESLITRARNNIVSDFLYSDSDRLVFIDSDVRFTVQDFNAVVESDKPVIGGLVPVKDVDYSSIVSSGARSEREARAASLRYAVSDELASEGNLRKVRYVGSAFLSIRRDVVEDMSGAYPELAYRSMGRPRIGLFETMIRDNHYLSEDYAFCQRWADIGGEVWVDSSVRLSHFGTYEFGATVVPIGEQGDF